MRKGSIAVFTILIFLSGTLVLGLGVSAQPISYNGAGLSSSSFTPAGLQVNPNGSVDVYGNAVLNGSYFTTQYDGHGAFFVSGNFLVESGATLHTNNLSIVFVKNVTFKNKGSVHMNSSIITTYNLSMRSRPYVTLVNYGAFTGNNSSLEFLGTFSSYSSSVVLTNGYYGKTGLSFRTQFQSSSLVLYNERVYGNMFWNSSSPIGGNNLVSMNFTNGNLYSYDSFFNIQTVPTSYSGKQPYPGGTIGLTNANAYFLNFSMTSLPAVNESYNFPIRVSSGDAYFFDGVSVSLFSPEGYPVYRVPFTFTESSSPSLQGINSIFYGSPFTKEFAPYPSYIGQNTTVYGVVDILGSSGLFVYNLYNLVYLGNNESVHLPALPLFNGRSLSLEASVPVLYVQVSNANVTYGLTSNVQVNYSSDGSISGNLSLSLGSQGIYSNKISTSPGVFVSAPVSFKTTLSPGNYSLNASFSGTSPYAFAPVSVPVTVHQDFFAKLGMSSKYSLKSGSSFATVKVFVNLSGQFSSSTGLLNLSVTDSEGTNTFSSLIPLYSGMKSVFPFTVPVSEPNTSEVRYSTSLTPILSYTVKSNYMGYLNQSLAAGLTGEKYGVIQSETGKGNFYLNFSIESLGVINAWTLYQNGIAVGSGNMTSTSQNVSVPIVKGENDMALELNGAPLTNTSPSTSWQMKFNFSQVALTVSAPPYIIENQSAYLDLQLSGLGKLPINDLQLIVNNASYFLNSTNLTIPISEGSNVVQLYEKVLGTSILVVQQTLNSTVISLPQFVVSTAKSLVGNYHLSVSVGMNGNITLNTVRVTGVGLSYSHSVLGNNETFLIYSKFTSAGTFGREMYLEGTYYSMPFNVSIPMNVTVLYPTYTIAYTGSNLVQFGVRHVELQEINMNGTGVFEPTTLTITGSSFYGAKFTHSYSLLPNERGILTVPVPLNIGTYHLSFRLSEGSGYSNLPIQQAIHIYPLVLPFWGYIIIIIAIAAGAGTYSYAFIRRSHGVRKSERMFVCYNCGKPVPYDAKICPHCRVKFADQVKCGDCGSEISRTMEYCPYCGNIMGQGFRLANYLKKKYREYVGENRKEIEQSLGRVEDDVFWKRLAKGELPIKKFDEFRAEFLVSGKYTLKGVVECPVCGSGNLISDIRCAICGAPMHLIIDYDRRVKEENDGGKKKKGDKGE